MLNHLKAAVAAASILFAGGASALTVDVIAKTGDSLVPSIMFNPAEFTVTGTVNFNVTNSIGGSRLSPFAGTSLDGEPYTAVQRDSSAKWNVGGDELLLIWGSPDTYNTLSFLDAADTVIDSITGGAIAALAGILPSDGGFVYARFTPSASFASVLFENVQREAFEFAQPNPIPLPAAGWMLVSALAGMSLLARRKRA